MRIFLVRHGDALGGLSPLGVAQIIAAANFLKQLDIVQEQTLLLTSPLKRAVESAVILRNELELNEPVIKEWLDNGRISMDKLSPLFSDRTQTLIATSHMPNIKDAVEDFAKIFGLNFNVRVNNGSVHLIDITNKKVERLFPQ